MQNIGDALVDGTLSAGMDAIRQQDSNDIEIKKKPKYLEVTERRMHKLDVIDLKPYFARSSKKERKKDGGWYLTIPIKRKTRDMSRRMYDQLRSIDMSPNERQTVVSDYLYDRRRDSDASMLNYTPRSKNIEKRRSGNNRHTYTAFRTVSDESPANSWMINRQNVNEKDTSKTFVKNVDRLMKWKMKNGWQ